MNYLQSSKKFDFNYRLYKITAQPPMGYYYLVLKTTEQIKSIYLIYSVVRHRQVRVLIYSHAQIKIIFCDHEKGIFFISWTILNSNSTSRGGCGASLRGKAKRNIYIYLYGCILTYIKYICITKKNPRGEGLVAPLIYPL